MSADADRLVRWLDERLQNAGSKGFVVGLSGGIDSAVVARLCQIARPGETLGVLMPCHSDPRDETDARMVADQFGLQTIRIDLAHVYDHLIADLGSALASTGAPRERPADDPRARLPMANVKPRLRMATLYFVANSLNYLVVGTGNRSELTIGYFTKHGDGGVDLLPLAGLVKRQVRELARELGVPAPIIDKAPSAGLWLGQTDEAEMGFTYADLEQYLNGGPDTVAPAIALKIDRLARASAHKRRRPATPDDESGEGRKIRNEK